MRIVGRAARCYIRRNRTGQRVDGSGMGRTMTKIKLSNYGDFWTSLQGGVPREQIRSVEIDALVDTGAGELAIPADVAERLGLLTIDRRIVRYADGRTESIPYAGGLLIEILGRKMIGCAYVLPAGTTPLLGQIPLEALDLVVTPRTQEVTVNPASPDFPLLDLLAAA